MFRVSTLFAVVARFPLSPARGFVTTTSLLEKMKIAIIGQSTFAGEVYKLLKSQGHRVVGVFTVPDKGNREDPLATEAAKDQVPVFKFKSWRRKGEAIPEVVEQYKSVDAELNVLPFCSQFIPMEVINHPKNKSICYHPSILPKHRGVSSISWTLISGDKKAGFSIFWADDGLDTGPLLLQKECDVGPDDTLDSVYSRFLYPEGIKSMVDAVGMVVDGTAPMITQPTEGASYEPALNKLELQKVKLDQPAEQIHNFIRGLDSSPGAWITLDGQECRVFGSTLWTDNLPATGREVTVEEMSEPALVHDNGLLLMGSDKKYVNVDRLSIGGKMIKAKKYGEAASEGAELTLTEEEEAMKKTIAEIWKGILQLEVSEELDFFASGAGSMDVVRLMEEIRDKLKLEVEKEVLFMQSTFKEFIFAVVEVARGGSGGGELEFSKISLNVNNMDVVFPHQLFINNQFVDSDSGKKLKSINPANEELICEVESASKNDVDKAVNAATAAFEGAWGKMSARDRAQIIFKLADLMDQHKEELATIESIDSGAVYTLALKTHVGMSIDTWRYFAGWCDKIQGTTIPISHARPNRNLTITKKEPIGVCGLVTPWNYPLMMLSWKMAPCLAAGNTVLIKPAQVSPLTALKFAELTVKAGFPPGVINVLPGTGSVCGQAIADHPKVRKLGFTGSTEIGKVIMKSCAVSNVKKCTLELGGKSPLIIFSDCDLDRAVRQGMGAVFFNKGENCIAAGRLFVEASIHDEFVRRVVEEVKKMVTGDPLDRSTSHGPQNHRAHLEKLVQYCDTGVKEGATLVYGGKQVDRPGLFMMPTIFTDVKDDMYIAQEESFGPIMVISKFDDGDVDGVLRRANNSEFGLASGVFTKDINKALYVSERIEAGTCFVNTYNKTDVAAPFGGFKQSGFGKDLGEDALNEYLRVKTITFEY